MSSLLDLTDRAWAIPVLAALAGGVAPRVPVLAAHLGASRAAVADAVDHLVALGVLARRTGHSHPLRPDMDVRDPAAAALAVRIMTATPASHAALLRKKWSLPILLALAEPKGFGALKAELRPVTARALSLALGDLAEAGLLTRTVIDAPGRPGTHYALTTAGRAIAVAARDV
jgi:DNA-binding HxlR family transcriptional regulator